MGCDWSPDGGLEVSPLSGERFEHIAVGSRRARTFRNMNGIALTTFRYETSDDSDYEGKPGNAKERFISLAKLERGKYNCTFIFELSQLTLCLLLFKHKSKQGLPSFILLFMSTHFRKRILISFLVVKYCNLCFYITSLLTEYNALNILRKSSDPLFLLTKNNNAYSKKFQLFAINQFESANQLLIL